ncbi:hypothetical protein BJV82DRAFT_105430 [Fennellomyces sp. T-0311]|nr:hypothetical protein BJV82DRAFT_105430 [Fennellomyces sp. T-0311]
MPATLTSLPAEILGYILSLLESWDEKYNLAVVNVVVWNAALRLLCPKDPYILPEDKNAINILRVSVSRSITVPSRVAVQYHLMVGILNTAYAAEAFTFVTNPEQEMSVITARRLLYYASKRARVRFLIGDAARNVWTRAYQNAAIEFGQDRLPQLGFLDATGKEISYEEDIDGYETPEDIQAIADDVKVRLKRVAVMTRQARPRENSAIIMKASLPILGALSWEQQRALWIEPSLYVKEETTFQDDELPLHIHNAKSIDAVVQRTAKHYIQSIVIFDEFWFFITAVDAFSSRTYDDCSNNSDKPFHEMATASISTKNYLGGKSFYELSIFVGHMELLVVGGFWGRCSGASRRDIHPFLGSSIPSIPKNMKQQRRTTDIYTLVQAPCTSTGTRLLRQYAKLQSGNMWSFSSLRFATKGFYPVNPLSYKSHTSQAIAMEKLCIHDLASLALRGVALPTSFSDKDIQQAMLTALKIKSMGHHFSDQQESPTFTGLSVNAKHELTMNNKKRTYWHDVIDLLAILEKLVNGINDKVGGISLTAIVSKHDVIQPLALGIMNNGLAAKVKACNSKVIEKFKQSYLC